MADHSGISWTQATWNVVTGCTPISSGCKNCYSRTMTKRLQAMGQKKYAAGFDKVVCHDDEKLMAQPTKWKKPRRIFVNSMSDTFHEGVPFEFLDKVYKVMIDSPQHIFQVLTKRPKRMKAFLEARLAAKEVVPENLYHGVTVENNDNLWRLDVLNEVPSKVKFVSFEPLIGSVGEVDLDGIHWVIVGGESGPGARRMDPYWADCIMRDARRTGVKFFMKQCGSFWAKQIGSKSRKGEIMEEWPEGLRIQEVPW